MRRLAGRSQPGRACRVVPGRGDHEATHAAADFGAADDLVDEVATTTAIQRLIHAGHLTRKTDAEDRRRAVVELTPRAVDLLDEAYGPVERAGRALLERYSGGARVHRRPAAARRTHAARGGAPGQGAVKRTLHRPGDWRWRVRGVTARGRTCASLRDRHLVAIF
jgi:hypothetical protein